MAINLKADIKPISYIKTNAADMMKYVNECRNPVIITQNGEARAVLLDIESFQNMQTAFALMNILQLAERDKVEGKFRDAQDVFKDLKKKLETIK